MNIQFNFHVEAREVSVKELADSIRRMAGILHNIHPSYVHWYLTPTGPKDIWMPLDDVDRFDSKLEKQNQPGVFMMAAITSRQNEQEWYKPGRTVVAFETTDGVIQLEISKADVFFGENFFSAMKDILHSFIMEEWVEWASLDCSTEVPDERPGAKKGATRTLDLSIDCRTFPHREFLGWMGWIQQLPPKKLLQASDLPQAAEVHPLSGRGGTMVVTVGEAFDMTNPSHIEKMQRVEVRLVELGLLPVIESGLV